MLLALRGGLRAEGTSVPWGAALAFVEHCHVEEEVSPRLDVSGRTLMTMESVRRGKKLVVRLRSGMEKGMTVFIGRTRREPIVVCSIFAVREMVS